MERQTGRLHEDAFNVESQARYNYVVESVARDLVAMREISGLHSSDEVFGYLNGVSAVISIVFGFDARPYIAAIVGKIVSSDEYREI